MRVGHLATIVTTSSGSSTRMVSHARVTYPFYHLPLQIQSQFRIFHRSVARTSSLGSRQTVAPILYN